MTNRQICPDIMSNPYNPNKTTPAERVFIFVVLVVGGLIAWLLASLCK